MSEIAERLDAARDRLRTEASPYLTVDEAAAIARCNPRTIRRACESGELVAFRPARRLLFREQDVREWVESRRIVTGAGRPRVSPPRRAEPGSVATLRAMEREMTR